MAIESWFQFFCAQNDWKKSLNKHSKLHDRNPDESLYRLLPKEGHYNWCGFYKSVHGDLLHSNTGRILTKLLNTSPQFTYLKTTCKDSVDNCVNQILWLLLYITPCISIFFFKSKNLLNYPFQTVIQEEMNVFANIFAVFFNFGNMCIVIENQFLAIFKAI